MIREVTGDILLSRADLIAHGVAPNDNFAQGLALALRERWPAMYKDFRHWCQSTHPDPGGLWLWSGPGSCRIASLLTQASAYEHGAKPGRASLEHVNHALRELNHVIVRERCNSVALPRLATGVGGLEWTEVASLVEKHLGSLKIPVVIYTTYRPGVAAEEGLDH